MEKSDIFFIKQLTLKIQVIPNQHFGEEQSDVSRQGCPLG